MSMMTFFGSNGWCFQNYQSAKQGEVQNKGKVSILIMIYDLILEKDILNDKQNLILFKYIY